MDINRQKKSGKPHGLKGDLWGGIFVKNMFEGMDERQSRCLEFLNSEEGQKVNQGLAKGSCTDYTGMFADMFVPGMELDSGTERLFARPAKSSEE